MIVEKTSLMEFLRRCQEENLGGIRKVIVPRRSMRDDKVLFFTPMAGPAEIVLDDYRTVDPVRVLFYFPRERVLPGNPVAEKRLIVGVKACDLKALQVLDRALINQDFVDPLYESRRKLTTLISVDCSEIMSTCHCNLVGGKPYAEEGFDLNLTTLDAQYFHISVGSGKGQELLDLMKQTIKINHAGEEDKNTVRERRRSMEKKLSLANTEYRRPDDYRLLKKTDIIKWVQEASACVGCGGCTNVCPTCYCIMLNDETTAATFIKDRSYDTCQVQGYARVAGGGTPRPKMFERFRNRYLCKFLNLPANFNLLGCTGCGRCSEVCAGKIEFREVVKKIMEASQMQETAHV